MRHTSYSTAHTSRSHMPQHSQGEAVHTVHQHSGATNAGASPLGGVSNAPQQPAQGAQAGGGIVPEEFIKGVYPQ
jgi:hypothetical protein